MPSSNMAESIFGLNRFETTDYTDFFRPRAEFLLYEFVS
jgi:hypothetical protein